MRVLVTGARGFIGRHVVARAPSNDEVVGWEGDVRAIGRHTEPADAVIHLAAAVRRDRFDAATLDSYEVNVIGTAAVLAYCRRVGARCVLASTCAVYSPASGPIPESSPVSPISPYGVSKWLAERLCEEQVRDAGASATVLRLFNVYGGGQHESFIVPQIIRALATGRPLPLRMPEAVRDFVHVDDVVDALFAAVRAGGEGCPRYNIGSGRGVAIAELIAMGERLSGREVARQEAPSHAGEASAVVADVTRARAVLGWQAQRSLESGLDELIREAGVGAG